MAKREIHSRFSNQAFLINLHFNNVKKLFIGSLLFIVCLVANAQSSTYLFSYFKDNGQDGLHLAISRDGLSWKSLNNDSSVLAPQVGKDKLMRDPCIIRGGDGNFHMVWTTGWGDRYIGYASSKDLLTWSEQRRIPVMEAEAAARNSWAPELTYDKKLNEYVIYWSTTIPGRFKNEGSEDNYNHRVYYTATKDFKTFTPSKLLIDPGFNCIDATIIPDGAGYRVFLKDETLKPPRKNLRTGTSKELKGPYKISDEVITGGYWAEGPTTIKLNGKWTVYFDKYQLGKYGAIESTDNKNWNDISEKLVMPEGIRHGSIIEITGEELERLLNKYPIQKKEPTSFPAESPAPAS